VLETSIERTWLELGLAQRAVWFDAQLADSPSAYTLVRLARIHGDFDAGAARQALTLVVARHDALRLRVDADLPRQWLHESSDAPFEVVDLSGAPDPEASLRAFVGASLERAMPLGDRALFELQLVKLGAREHAALLRCHHLLADEVAVSLVLRYWLGAYCALTSDAPVELDPPSSFVAEIASDLAYAESERHAADLAYWKARFATPSPPLLEARRSERADAAGAVRSATWLLADGPYERFAAATARAGVTPQRAIFALLAVVLGRRYGLTDVTLGMALHRRNAANAHVVGMLAGTIAIRLETSGDASLREVVRAASVRIDEDLRHQRLPIDALSRALGLSADGLSALFSVAVSYVPAPRAAGDVPGSADVTFELESLPTHEASPLTVHAYERADGRALAIDFAALPHVLDDAGFASLMTLFQTAVTWFVDDPDAAVETFPRTTPDERALVTATWNATGAAFPQGTADAFVAERARRDPAACAVTSARGSLAYGELDARANALARRLVESGVPLGAVVGVALERSVASVVALLAILKAGCVYLPLDVAYPPDRIAFMLADSGAVAVLTDAACAHVLPQHPRQLRVDDARVADDASIEAPGRGHGPKHVAYVIYTSGSTGTPKGVAVPHAAAVNLAFARLGHDPIGPGDRVLAAISVGFDVSIGQLLLPLLAGATIAIADDLRTLSARDFWAFLADHRVTHANSVPSFFDSVVDAAPRDCGLVRLMLGGEPLSAALVRRLRRALPRTEIVNMYGPTEACIDATVQAASGDETAPVIPIGRPLPNYRAYVLDAVLEPVGIGVAGDLYLAGAGLAHGYAGDPARTAERFVADPFGAPGERLYRTGDRARWTPAGALEFLGRDDAQIKIRGHRIELGEIEAALRAHPAVAGAAVVANAGASGSLRLVAYVVCDPAAPPPDAAQLRSALAERLPDYMIPVAYRTLPALPLTANGKLDERALPPVEWDAERVYVAPRGERERDVAALFAELLGVRAAGATDNFFELGGHSLLATRLVSQLRARFAVDLKLRAVFENPTVAGLARCIDAAAGGPPALGPVHVPRSETPLSFAQERLWFLAQLQADDTYNVPFAVRVRGEFSVEAAADALERIVARHEALRTCIALRDGRPGAIVREAADFVVERVDLSGLDDAKRSRAFDDLLRGFTRTPFDLATDLPFRAAIVSLGPREHVVAAVAHHAAFDGWSGALFLSEFARLYAAPPDARDGALAPLAFRYADFAAWQRAQDESEALAYWSARLADAPARLEFPADRVPASAGRRPAERVRIDVAPATHAALLAVANAHGASLFMLLHAAFAAMLARWTGQTDLVIGTVVANRPDAAFEPIVGCFVNTLALRTSLDPRATFADLLRSIRDDDLAAFEHQGLPFERVVDALQPERSLAQTPLFGAMLVVQPAPPDLALAGVVTERVALEPGAAKFDLTLDLAASPGGALDGSLEYAADTYDAATIARFVTQFERLLDAVAADPHARPLALDLLDPAERAQLVDGWNATAAPYPSETADRAFARRAEYDPGALAVTGAAGALTYGELHVRSHALARRLAARGVVRGSVVGVALERSIETVVALLAILEAGATYLPLDPAYPPERLAFMTADAHALLAIVDAATTALLPSGLARLFVDETDPADEDALPELARSHGPRDVAYVIYTSGSTGNPKGVAVSHAAALNLAFARHVHDPIGPGDRVLAAISVGFDVSIGQLLLPLLSGATIVIAADVRSYAPAAFWEFLEAHAVTHVNSVPSFFESILAAAPAHTSLIRLMLGGEALSSALVRRLRRALPATQVVNMYGPTEACIDATYYVTDATEQTPYVPIGVPLPNYRAYVLNARLDPVGIGVAGDLYLGGAGLAHGYVGAPALTAERFIADPFGRAGERLYKTGDRARWTAAGLLEFLGRADTQVKVRGHRIELGEIEARLTSQAGVREAAAIVREDTPGDPRIVAYYTASESVPAETLRAALLETLPGYMVPAAFVFLDALPLTTNGKLDRRALPAPDAGAYPIRVYEAPQGALEARVAQAFAAVLSVPNAGRHDNFFELGGHSLLAMTLIDRLGESGVHVDVRDLFSAPTVAGVAAAASTAAPRVNVPPNRIPRHAERITPEMLPLVHLTQSEIDGIVARVPGGAANVRDIYPLAPLQEGMLFHHVMSERGDAYLTPFLLGFADRDRLDAFLAALDAVIARHDILRTALAWETLAAPVQVVAREAPLPVEEVAFAAVPDVARALLERFDPRTYRIDVSRVPLMRAFVARDAANDRWLLLLLSHHLILDHTSLEVVLHEIAAISAGRAHALAEPEPFRTFVARARLGITSDEHEAFFRDLLAGVDEPTAPFGLVGARGAAAEVREASLALDLPPSARVRERARALGVGPAALFHLAWALVLAHASGRDDVVFGTLLFGRMQHGGAARPTLGLFVNTLPMRVKLDAAGGVAAAVHETQRLLADLLRHEHASLALAQRCSGVPAPAPLFSALFNFRRSPAVAAGDAPAPWPGGELLFAQERTDYPLAVAIDDRTDDFLITAQTAEALDPRDVCAHVVTAIASVLHALETEPAAELRSLNVLPSGVRERVTTAWNDTFAVYPSGTLHELVVRQTARTPDAVAVTDGTDRLTYAELDARAEALADVLAARGVRRGSVVGVALERSIGTVVALLAILKAGATYLPLDPSYPPERLAFAIDDARAELVITNRTTAALVAAPVASLDIDAAEAAAPRAGRSPDPRDVAYVIYTSGSTGNPKGVAVSHAAALNLAFARHVHDPIGPGDRVLAAISVGFDVSIGQLLLPLLSGATIVIAADVRSYAPAAFWEFLETHGVTHVNSVPSFFESILAAAPAHTSLIRLMLGGEALSSALVRRLRRALPQTQVVNMYGPTEACIDATYYVTNAAEETPYVPIGVPLPNYRAYVLNGRLDPVGIGVAGDLYLGGAGLAHGYVGAPALTAERFIADPFGAAGERLYKTGDRARWTAAGLLEFLGRADTQVKVRGHRIELGEIEARLASQAGVREAAAIVREDVPGDPRIVAYYTADDALRPEALRAALGAALPEYMVPAAFVHLDALPLTTNGKLDRTALPAPASDAFAVRPFVAPEGEVERSIATIFAEVVRAERAGRDDNFFELGGHSLLAMTLIERLRAAGLHVDVRDLFATPTVAGLAAAAREATPSTAVPPNAIVPGTTALAPAMLPLVQLTQHEIDGLVARVPGGVANVQDVYPLAPLQEGILFRHLMSERGDAYLAPFLLAFERRAVLDGFLEALRAMIARHDILRTAIVWEGLSEPVQIVLREASLPLDEIALDAGEAEDASRALRERYDSRRFRIEVGRAPMLRAIVTHDARNDRWLLLLLSHHLILDHTSLDVILAEVALVAAGRAAELPPTAPFRNFIASTRSGATAQEHEAFFRALLGDVNEPTLPYGLAHVRGDGGGIREGSVALDRALSQRLRDRARALGVGPATILHVAWALVLAHVSGRDDVVFGTLLFGRMSGGEARTLGMFINTLPVRARVGGDDAVAAVRAMHALLAGLLRHEHASLALAQRASGVAAPAPLFSALFNFRQSPPGDPASARAWPGVEFLFAQERTDYPISLAVDDRTHDFLVTALTDAPADPARVCALMETAVANLLDALASERPVPLYAVGVLPRAAYERVVTVPNATHATFEEASLGALFEAQAARTPHAPALVDESETLTYAELRARVEAFAGALSAQSATIGTVVGVALPRSAATTIVLLAIVKIGAVYLPLDTSHPPERLAHAIADAGAAFVIAGAAMRALLPAGVRVVDVAAPFPLEPAPVRPIRALTPADTAYVIYTSGSTGKPKGVAVPHRAAVNLAFARLRHDPIGPGDRVLAAISVGFDVSIGQLLLPLLSGATVAIASDLRTLAAHEFWEFLEARGVTHVNSVPSFFESILDAAPATTSLRRIMLGGEPLSSALVRRLRRALPATDIVNMYGPTEACIDATCAPVTGSETAAVLPIGRPLPNYRAYVLNARLEPVDIGVAGDLYLAGAGLAHGYVGAPALTATRFIADPFGAPGERLYATGDRARWNADGALEFLGRTDAQVKVRGHRVELGEIEAALRAHPHVAAAAVVAQTLGDVPSRLAAYVVAHAGGEAPGAEALRAHLAARLPDYMLPAAFATLPELPLTANGKLDPTALPVIARDAASEAPFEPPQTETERALERIWAGVLGVDAAGRNDDFFSLGGHSLAAIRLIAACNARFERKLPLRILFDRPTIAGLAAAIDGDIGEPAASFESSLVPLRSSGTRTPLFCVHPAGGHVFCYVPLVKALSPDQPVYGLQARALEAGEPLVESIEDLAAAYVRAIRARQSAGPYRLLGMSSGGLVAYEMARRLRESGDTVDVLALLDTSVPGTNGTFDEVMLVRGVAGEFGVADLLAIPPEPPTLEALFERARALRRIPPQLDRAFADRVAAVYRNAVRACDAYRPAPWDGAFALVRALRRERPGDAPPDWSPFVTPDATCIDLDCTHADLMSDALAPALARHLEPLLRRTAHGSE
jgi:amino acid adenylation domain-containing protein